MQKPLILLAGVLVAGCLVSGESLAAVASNATQAVSGGGVTVKATYINLRSNENPRFEVVLETHSVALDGYDLKSLALLRDDKGMSYSPTAIENRGGGHHRQITITFPNESHGSKILELIIKDIAGVKERGFRWVLE